MLNFGCVSCELLSTSFAFGEEILKIQNSRICFFGFAVVAFLGAYVVSCWSI